MTRAAIYVRISRDRANEVSTQVQERAARQYCELKGWEVADVYADVGFSAFRRIVRPEYDRMLQDVEAGLFEAVVIYKLDRLSRSVIELQRVAEVLKQRHVDLASVNDAIDTSSPGGRFVYGVLAGLAQMESEQISLRVRGALELRAVSGKPHGGPRVYGYEPDGTTVRPAEAVAIREAAERVVAGEPLRAIAREFTDRGITTATGKSWYPQTLRRTLMSSRIAGHRNGVAGWAPLITADLQERVSAILRDPTRTVGNGGGGAPRHLLAGIAWCGICGGRLTSSQARGVVRYACVSREGGPRGCGRIAIAGPNVEAEVRDQVIKALASPALADALLVDVAAARDYAAAIEQIDQDLDILSQAHFVEHVIDRPAYLSARETLTERRDAAEDALSRVRVTSGLDGLPTDFAGLQAAWAEHDPVWRRTLVRVVIERVTIHPTEVRGRFDPDRIEIGWRSPGESAKPAPTTPAATRLIERTAASRAAAGLPLNVDEAAALRRIAVLLRDSD